MADYPGTRKILGYNQFEVSSQPPWLQDPLALAWAEAHGLLKDILVDGARHAVLLRLPDSAAPDSLPLIADERQLEPMPGETQASWVARLLAAWTAWQYAGTVKGVVDNIKLTGLTNVQLFDRWDWPDGNAAAWARFYVVIGPPHAWVSDGTWGDPGTWGDGGTWGSNATPDEVARVVRQVRLWKAAHAHCEGIFVVLSGELWGSPTGTWGDPGTWGTVAVQWML